MATKIHHLEAFKGLDGMKDLLNLLVNPAKYSGLLDELEQAYKDAAAIVELVGPAQEIPKILGEANRKLAQAEKSAKESFDKIREANQASMAKIKEAEEAFDAKVAETNAKLNGRSHHLASELAKVTKKEREVEADRQDLDARLAKLAAAEAAAEALKSQYEEKLRRFKEATSE